MTGELADGWLPIFYAPGRMGASYGKINEGAENAGRSLADITVSPQVSIYVTDNREGALERERPHIAFYIGGMGTFYHEYMHRIGFGEEADVIRKKYLAGDRFGAASSVTDDMVSSTTLIGNPEECSSQMEKYFEDGVDEIRLVFNEQNSEAYKRAIEAMAAFI
jgi:alkanesulfonate monooxygenase SsuD/methylene tetrahydromethanopterin reductase-like flavin-dependent oxidoreductase (luciferase family)